MASASQPFISVRTRWLCSGLIASVLLGCGPAEEQEQSLTFELDATTPEGVVGRDVTGVGRAVVELRSVNAFGVPVASSSTEVLVDGQPRAVEFDARGAGSFELVAPGTHLIELPSGERLTAHVLEDQWQPQALLPADLAPTPDRVMEVRGGRLIEREGTVWWVAPGAAPVAVLDAPDGERLEGFIPADLDFDGLSDLAVWSSKTLYLLRGTEQGYTWATALQTDEATFAGLAIVDIDGDAANDLVVALRSRFGDRIEVLSGDPLQGFELQQLVELVGRPVDLAINGTAKSGVLELTVLEDDGLWERFRQTEGGLFVLVRSEPPTTLPEDGRLAVAGDFHGDGVEDVVVATPTISTRPTTVQIFNLASSPQSFITRQPQGAWMDLADADGDGTVELWTVLPEGDVKVMSASGDQPVEWTTGRLPAGGVFTVMTEGALPDLWMHPGDHWRFVPGGTSDQAIWRVASQPVDNLLSDIVGAWPIPGDEHTWWAGLQVRDGEVVLKRWRRETGASTVVESGRLTLGAEGELLDVAVCGTELFAIVGAELLTASLDAAPTETARVATTALRVACAPTQPARLALLDGGTIRYLDDALVETTTESAPGAQDLALVMDGELLRAGVCTSTGCTIMGWADAPGGPDFVTTAPDGLRLGQDPDAPVLLGGTRALVADLDGNGVTDLLSVRSDGLVVLHRTTASDLAAPALYWTSRADVAPWFSADSDGDGRLELFATDGDGRLFTTAPPP